MEKFLNYILAVMMLMGGIASCKLYQQKNEEKQQSSRNESRYEAHELQLHSRRRDSLSRYWIFWSDSAFRFHADSGLSGQSGRLFVQESKASTSLRNRLSIAVRDSVVQTAIKKTKEESQSVSMQHLWLIGLIGIVFFVLWKVRKFY